MFNFKVVLKIWKTRAAQQEISMGKNNMSISYSSDNFKIYIFNINVLLQNILIEKL